MVARSSTIHRKCPCSVLTVYLDYFAARRIPRLHPLLPILPLLHLRHHRLLPVSIRFVHWITFFLPVFLHKQADKEGHMQINPGSLKNVYAEVIHMIDAKTAFEMIDKIPLESCHIMLAMSAVDLAEDLERLIAAGTDPHTLLTVARNYVKQAYLRENN